MPKYNKLNPLEKEVLIKLYRRSRGVKISEFCRANDVAENSFRRWMRDYDAMGLDGLYRAGKSGPELLPPGVDPTAEAYKRELIKARLENERLKKNYTRTLDEDGNPTGFEPLSGPSTPS